MRRPSICELVTVLLAAALAAALLTSAYLGLFARYMADDYCYGESLHELGFLAFQRRWYMEWTGRFSFSLAVAAAEWVGPVVVPCPPAAILVCWVAAAVWSVYRVAVLLRLSRPLLSSLVLGELVVFATLNGAHNIAQSLYWQTGMLTYIPPLILFTIFVGVACRGVDRRREGRAAILYAAACGVLAFAAGGFSEAYTLAQAFLLLLALVTCVRRARPPLRRGAQPIAAAGLAGALLAGCVVWLAPGNAVRMSYFPATPSLVKLVALSLYYSAGFIAYTVYLSPLTMTMSAVLPALLGFCIPGERPDRTGASGPRQVARALLLPPLIGFVLIFCCTVTAVYGTSQFLPQRARLIPQFVLVCVAVCWGRAAGVILSERLGARALMRRGVSAAAPVVVAALLLLIPLAAARRSLGLVTRARAAAEVWDEMDQALRMTPGRGGTDVTVAPIDDVEERFGASKTELQIEHDPQNWKNRCAARYYGVNSLKAE